MGVSVYMLCALLVALGMKGTRLLEWAVRGFPPPREYVVIHHGGPIHNFDKSIWPFHTLNTNRRTEELDLR